MVVVGAGAAGLATAAALREGGRDVRSSSGPTGWARRGRARYDSLHLHTVRWLSGLPGLRIPRRTASWVARDDLVRYLATYARRRSLATGARHRA